MKLNRYVKQVERFPTDDKHLLFNTLTHGFVEIDEATRRFLDAPDGEGNISRRIASRLRKMGFLVSDRKEERKWLDRYFGRMHSQINSILQATVLTTYDCNFACSYCVEQGVIRPVYMREETAVASSDFIIQRARESRVKSIYLMFYGGEPLMNPEAIRIVADRVGSYARRKRLGFAFSITTNGALLTPELVDDLVAYGLDGVKVTLDGNRECHNALRPFCDGSGSFDLVLDNVVSAADKVRVDIGGNFDQSNLESFGELLDILEERGLREKLDKISFKPISETPIDRDGVSQFSELECVYARESTAHESVRLRNMLIDRGFPTEPGIGVTICGATISNVHFTIDPNGVLYRCPAFVGREELRDGDIYTSKDSDDDSERDLWRRCAGCENVAMCGDGCMYGSYLRYGDPLKVDCRREYVDYVVQENLKTWYKGLAAGDDNELNTTP